MPLKNLQAGMASACTGQFVPIQVSNTGDEIEALGHTFNRMIATLAASREEIQRSRDLMERRIQRRTEAMETTMRRAQSASDANSNFLASVWWELAAPLDGIRGTLETLLQANSSPESRQRLDDLRGAVCSLSLLLNDLRDYAELQAGRLMLHKVPFDARALVEGCVRAHKPSGSEGLEIRCEIAPEIPRQVVGDPLRVRQIVSHLVDNAVKFTNQGSVVVQLGSAPCGSGGIALRLRVSDTGSGIEAEKLLRIFDMPSPGQRASGGRTGLGLMMVKALAEMHEGTVRIDSEPGRGTVVSVEIQCGTPQASEAPTVPACGRPVSSLNALENARILVVEDNLVNQKVVVAVLRKRGYAVELANDGREALHRLEQEDFDVVIMDVQMPVLDGLETTRLIRRNERWKTLPIVAMTAHAMTGDRERCLDAGMNAYISKPVHPARLLEIIEQQLASLENRRAAG